MFDVLFLEGNKPIRLIHVEIIIRKLYFWCLSSFFFVSSFIRQTNCPSTSHCHWHHYLCVSECPWTFSWPCTLINFLYLYSFFFFVCFLFSPMKKIVEHTTNINTITGDILRTRLQLTTSLSVKTAMYGKFLHPFFKTPSFC